MEENINGFEIPEDLLECIAGGVLDDASMQSLEGFVKGLSASGLSSDEIIDKFAFARNGKGSDDILRYVSKLIAKRP